RLLRALVKEQVPIRSWEEIIHVVQEFGLDDLNQTQRAVRLRLKRELPGNGPAAEPVNVPREWENWLKDEHGKMVFSASARETHRLLAEIRGWVQSVRKVPVLVTHTPELRPFIKRLVESEFPQLMTLTADEALSPEELSAMEGTAPVPQTEGGGNDVREDD